MDRLKALGHQSEGLAQPLFQSALELLVHGLAHVLEALTVLFSKRLELGRQRRGQLSEPLLEAREPLLLDRAGGLGAGALLSREVLQGRSHFLTLLTPRAHEHVAQLAQAGIEKLSLTILRLGHLGLEDSQALGEGVELGPLALSEGRERLLKFYAKCAGRLRALHARLGEIAGEAMLDSFKASLQRHKRIGNGGGERCLGSARTRRAVRPGAGLKQGNGDEAKYELVMRYGEKFGHGRVPTSNQAGSHLPVVTSLGLVARVLVCAAAREVGGILGAILCHLLLAGGEQIYAESIGQTHEINLDIGDLIRDGRERLLVERVGLFGSQPLKVFLQFARFDREGHGEILRAVEALPLAFLDEGGDVAAKLLERFHDGVLRRGQSRFWHAAVLE